jgi:hypothetical protein
MRRPKVTKKKKYKIVKNVSGESQAPVESQLAPLCVPVLLPCPLLLFDDAGGKSVSETSKSLGEKCVSENSTGGKSGATRTSNNPFAGRRFG